MSAGGTDVVDDDEHILTPFNPQPKSVWSPGHGAALKRFLRVTKTPPRYTSLTAPTDADEPRRRKVDYQQIDATTTRVLGAYASGALYQASEEFTKREGAVPVRDEQSPLVIRTDFGGRATRDVFAQVATRTLAGFIDRISQMFRELQAHNVTVVGWGAYLSRMTSEQEMERIVRQQVRRARAVQLGQSVQWYTGDNAADPIVPIDFDSFARGLEFGNHESQLLENVVQLTIRALSDYGQKAFQVECAIATQEAAMIEHYKMARAMLPMQRAESDMRGTQYVEYLDYLTGDVNIRQKLYDRALHHHTLGDPGIRDMIHAALFDQEQRERDERWNEAIEPGPDLDDDPMQERYMLAEQSRKITDKLSSEISAEVVQRLQGMRSDDAVLPFFVSFAVFPSDLKWQYFALHKFQNQPRITTAAGAIVGSEPGAAETARRTFEAEVRKIQEMRRVYYARYLADDVFAPTRHHLELQQSGRPTRLKPVEIEATHGDSATFEKRARVVQLYDPPSHRYDHELFWTGERPLLNLSALSREEYAVFYHQILMSSGLAKVIHALRTSRLRVTLYLQLLRRAAPPSLGMLEMLELRARDPRRLLQLRTQFNSIVQHHSEFHQYARIIVLPSLHPRRVSVSLGPKYTLGFVPRVRGSNLRPIPARAFWNNRMLGQKVSLVRTPRTLNIEALSEYYDERLMLRRRFQESVDVTPDGIAETLDATLTESLRQTYKHVTHSVDGEWLALLPLRESADSGESRFLSRPWGVLEMNRFKACGLLATRVIDDRPNMIVAPVRVSRQHVRSYVFRPTLVPPSWSSSSSDYLFHNPRSRHGIAIDVGEAGQVIVNLQWAVKIPKENFDKCVSRELTSLDNRGWITTMNGLSVNPERATKLHVPPLESEKRDLERLLGVSIAENSQEDEEEESGDDDGGATAQRKYKAVNHIYSLRIPVTCTVMLRGSIAPTSLPVGSAFIDVTFGIVEQLLMPVAATQWDVHVKREAGGQVKFAQQLQMHVQAVFISRAAIQPLMHAQPTLADPHAAQIANDCINREADSLGPAMKKAADEWEARGVVPLRSTALFMSKFGQSKSSS